METCCVCSNVFVRRPDLKGYEKRPILGQLRKENVNAYEVLKLLFDYKVNMFQWKLYAN